MPLHKPCRNCGKRFKPTTVHTKLCEKCRLESYRRNKINLNACCSNY